MAPIFSCKTSKPWRIFPASYWTLFSSFRPLPCGQLAEENKSGTIDCPTKPITDWQVVLGKFMATLLLIVIALALTLPYYITVANLGPIDHGAVLTGYLGLILMSAAYISIGIFTSSVSNNQIVSFLLALFLGIFFQIIFSMLSTNFSGLIGQVLDFMSVSSHFDSISRGVIDTKDLLFFFSLIFLGLIMTEANLAGKRN
ncbi:MAG: ABC transporter permease subunit [Bacteroidales bacterium]